MWHEGSGSPAGGGQGLSPSESPACKSLNGMVTPSCQCCCPGPVSVCEACVKHPTAQNTVAAHEWWPLFLLWRLAVSWWFWPLRPVAGVSGAPLVAQTVKNPPAMQEAWVQFLGQENPLEKGDTPVFLLGESHGQRTGGLQSIMSAVTPEQMRKGCWAPAQLGDGHAS